MAHDRSGFLRSLLESRQCQLRSVHRFISALGADMALAIRFLPKPGHAVLMANGRRDLPCPDDRQRERRSRRGEGDREPE